MSQRNPMNDRYQSELPGQTRKSASSLKPKSKAAASVYVKPTGKSKQEKKAIKKEQRAKQAELDRMYYNPPTAEYKKLRRLWWVLLGVAVVSTVLAMVIGNMFPDSVWATWGLLIPAYGCIIGALWLDFSKIRKVRRAYQLEMMKKNPKQMKKHVTTHSANVHAEKKEEERKSKGSLVTRFGHTFGKKKEEAPAKAEPTAEEIAAAEAAKKAEEDSHKTIAQLKAEREAAKAEDKTEEE